MPTFRLTRRHLLASAPLLALGATPDPQDYVLLVFNAPVPGREQEYNDWYNHTHLPAVTSVPGFVSGQRFHYATAQIRATTPPPNQYLSLYRITTHDLAAVFKEVNRRLATGITKLSPALDNSHAAAHTFQAIRPAITHQGAFDPGPHPQQIAHLVYADPTPGMDQAYNDWYDRYHAPQIVALDGATGARRYARSATQLVGPTPTQYLTIFDFLTPDYAAFVDHFHQIANKMTSSPSFDSKHTYGYSYAAIGPVLKGYGPT